MDRTGSAALQAAAGQLLVVGYQGMEAPSPAVSTALRAGHLGGVILFSRNIGPGAEGLLALAAMNEAIHRCVPYGSAWPLVAVDQEGGRVRRLREGVTLVPPMAVVGRAGSRELAARVSEVVASEVGALGFNLNFAPVLDVFTNPANTVIGDRAFGVTAEHVAEMAGAFCVGHYTMGVIPCGKHFPGHGDTVADSHFELPVLLHSTERLEAVELVPFARAVASRIPMLMTAHVLVPALEALHPMTLSPVGIGRLLRQEMGYEGVVITDDLEMKAVADRYAIEDMVELGLAAGVDIFLICHTEEKWQRAFEQLVRLAERDAGARERVMASSARVLALKRAQLPSSRYEVPSSLLAELDTAEHRAVMAELERAAGGAA